MGWSARNRILGKAVYNSRERWARWRSDHYPGESGILWICGTGGFLGIAQHDVAIPVEQSKLDGDKLMLTGATKEGLKAAPKWTRSKSEAVQGG